MAFGLEGILSWLDPETGQGVSPPYAPGPEPPMAAPAPSARVPAEDLAPRNESKGGLMSQLSTGNGDAASAVREEGPGILSEIAHFMNLDSELGRRKWSNTLSGLGQGILSRGYGESTGQGLSRGFGLASQGIRDAGREQRAEDLREYWTERAETADSEGSENADLFHALAAMDPRELAGILPAMIRAGSDGGSWLEKLMMADKLSTRRHQRNRDYDKGTQGPYSNLKNEVAAVKQAMAGHPGARAFVESIYPWDWSGGTPPEAKLLVAEYEKMTDPYKRSMAYESMGISPDDYAEKEAARRAAKEAAEAEKAAEPGFWDQYTPSWMSGEK